MNLCFVYIQLSPVNTCPFSLKNPYIKVGTHLKLPDQTKKRKPKKVPNKAKASPGARLAPVDFAPPLRVQLAQQGQLVPVVQRVAVGEVLGGLSVRWPRYNRSATCQSCPKTRWCQLLAPCRHWRRGSGWALGWRYRRLYQEKENTG